MYDYIIEFDPDSKLSYGSWKCHECGAEFFGPGVTFHEIDCSRCDMSNRNYFSGLIYKYTSKEIDDSPCAPVGFREKLANKK
jgi:hypothetical protein